MTQHLDGKPAEAQMIEPPSGSFIEKKLEDGNEGESDDEIDKEQFLNIVNTAFNKIISSMHPRIGQSLQLIQEMYTHFIE